MPELPEVQTIVTDLNKILLGFKITDVKVLSTFKIQPEPEEFTAEVKGKKIAGVQRVAKNIILEMENNKYLLVHLAMTGQLRLSKTAESQNSSERVCFTLEKGGKKIYLKYNDVRMFGKVALLATEEYRKLKEKYGPDPLDKTLTAENFLNRLKSRKTNIKNALLDQSIVAGVGNIYATDALFMAGIHPETSTKDLSDKDSHKLLESLREILEESIGHRGSTLKDEMYVDILGKKGTHQDYFRIYGKQICPVCGGKIEYKKISGRGTYICNVCQSIKHNPDNLGSLTGKEQSEKADRPKGLFQ